MYCWTIQLINKLTLHLQMKIQFIFHCLFTIGQEKFIPVLITLATAYTENASCNKYNASCHFFPYTEKEN